MAKSEYTDLTYFMIYGYKLVKNSENTNAPAYVFPWCSGILQNRVEIFHQPPFVITSLI